MPAGAPGEACGEVRETANASDHTLAGRLSPRSRGGRTFWVWSAAARMVDETKISGWGTAPTDLSLGADEVHVWRATLNSKWEAVDRMLPVLSRRERREARRHELPKHFATGRFMVRTLLARYLGCEPERLKLRSGRDGRPVLDERGAPHFDYAWAQARGVFAISATHPVGVFVDAVPADLDVSAWLRELPPREASRMEFLSPENRARSAVGYQAEQEALRRLAAVLGEDPARTLPDCRVERLQLGKRYVAALAAQGWDWSAGFWHFQTPGETGEPEEDQ